MKQENHKMRKRIAGLGATLGATILLMLVLLPPVAQAAESPWWQVLTSSRPGNMWEPVDSSETQEVTGQSFNLFGFAEIFAAEVKVSGEVVGCLGSGSLAPFGGPSADEACEAETGFGASETSAEFEEMLEGPYGAGQVQVTGGPAGAAPFKIESPWVPPIEVTVLQGEFFPLGENVGSKVLSEGSGRLVAIITNLGDAPVDATATPVTIVDQMPEGVKAVGVEAVASAKGDPLDCGIKPTDIVVCTFEGILPSYEAIEVEVIVSLTGEPPAAGTPGEVTVSGGNAGSASAVQEVKVSPEETPFGIEHFSSRPEEEGGGDASQAGGHPFQLTTTIQLNAGRTTVGPTGPGFRDVRVDQPAMPRNLRFPLPRGLVGNATVMAQCDMTTFLDIIGQSHNACPAESAIGATAVTVIEARNLGYLRFAVPVFNLPPGQGEPARFGFVAAGVPVVIDTEVKPEDGYRIVAKVRNIPQVATFLSSTVVFWGSPGDPRHDSSRGWNCVFNIADLGPCERPPNLSEDAFLRQPVSCDGPLDFDAELEPWNVPIGSVVEKASSAPAGMKNCHKVPFDPSIAVSPSSKLAANPSGLSFQLDMPNFGLASKDGIAEGQPKKVEVDLPEGMTINPSQGEGLVGCSPAEYGRETASSGPGEGCPEASKVGTVQVSTPLLEEEARGSLYVASPHDNPFGSLLALYMVAKIPERGILIK